MDVLRQRALQQVRKEDMRFPEWFKVLSAAVLLLTVLYAIYVYSEKQKALCRDDGGLYFKNRCFKEQR